MISALFSSAQRSASSVFPTAVGPVSTWSVFSLGKDMCFISTYNMSNVCAKLAVFAFIVVSLCACRPQPQGGGGAVVASDDFSHGLGKWVVEQMPGGSVRAEDGVLTINDEAGCTVWLRQKLVAPVVVSYEVTMSADARVSDMNCFWMASDPRHPEDIFFEGHERSGKFSTYDSLNLYYV